MVEFGWGFGMGIIVTTIVWWWFWRSTDAQKKALKARVNELEDRIFGRGP